MRRVATVRVIELALVAVGALLPVGTGLRQVGGQGGPAQEVVQRRAVPTQRVVRRHEPDGDKDISWNLGGTGHAENHW